MIQRDLEKVRVVIKEATELDIAYAYDDLVFPDNTAFIIQFDDNDANNYFCYFHTDCLADAKEQITADLSKSFKKHRCSLTSKGSFQLNPKGEEVEIQFS